MDVLADLKDLPEFANFSGTVIYRTNLQIADTNSVQYLNIGKVYGISQVTINGKDAGTKWYGRRVYTTAGLLQNGMNTLEIKVVTVMVNYMKSLTENKIAQYWTNEKRKIQPLQSMGLVGPVTIL